MEFDLHASFDLRSLEKNFQHLKQNVRGLANCHLAEMSGRVLHKISTLFDRVNCKVVSLNQWAQQKIQHFHEQQPERKELEQQILLMESEGNNPSTTTAD